MGLLTVGKPLPWSEAKKHADHVRSNGIKQFLNIYNRLKDRHNDQLKFGEELEFIVVTFDDEKKTARVTLRVSDVLAEIQEEQSHLPPGTVVECTWHPEYGRYMIEGVPGGPYGFALSELTKIESNMRGRRVDIQKRLAPNEAVVSITNFPRLGCPAFTEPPYEPYGPIAKSLFIPDEAINPHPRFGTLTKSIRERKGARVNISVPVFHDTNTPRPFIEKFPNDDGEAARAAKPDTIYMDAMCFGMGCCCVQVTFQACSITEARYLYDQLACVSPVLLALTAACPVFRGLLADVDCRWNVIAQSVDDRTPEEMGEVPLKNNKYVINKSRYDSIDSFLSPAPYFQEKYNDIPLVMDDQIRKELEDNGIDPLLSQHVAHLFIRDPLVVFGETLNVDNNESSEHFENLQSTNWQTMRFKPPPPNTDIGWRVEFRCMELQISDFENAAFTAFIVLLTRAILSYNLNLYIPISKVDENIQIAQQRNAAQDKKFYFRKHLSPAGPGMDVQSDDDPDAYELMSINTIINGQAGGFIGLLPLVRMYLDAINVDVETRCHLSKYLNFIAKRASGELMTTASWIRHFVHSHPDYKFDSQVPDSINHDLLRKIYAAGMGHEVIPELTGTYVTPHPPTDGAK
eukprot:comp22522_c0_seq1/m.34168 comp22522_c0_seq1/g.34168  ORF comp22522_c0_seq1/g.34168 comp22522_c0_seq1/m.34168 type:complete len:630 (-) comp22522_c0_seq1:499-2388(-)